ncbi:hypothetical protein EVC30_118 [Rhizobium phage RHph_Y1_11]|nr:hypothetical protein EVC30_118 [Rhizobium phage RHph_Y1_11]
MISPEKYFGVEGASMTDEIFTYIRKDNGEHLDFNVTKIINSPRFKFIPTINVAIERDFAQTMPEQAGIEKHRVLTFCELLKRGMEDQIQPVLFLRMDDGSHILADGNNRYFAYACMGRTAVPAKIIPKGIWKKCMVTGLPKFDDPRDLQKMPSGY